MDIVYNGGSPLAYHSAPSQHNYVFDPGVAQKVKSQDEEFFQDMAASPNSPWQVVGIVETIEAAVDNMTEKISNKFKPKGGKKKWQHSQAQ